MMLQSTWQLCNRPLVSDFNSLICTCTSRACGMRLGCISISLSSNVEHQCSPLPQRECLLIWNASKRTESTIQAVSRAVFRLCSNLERNQCFCSAAKPGSNTAWLQCGHTVAAPVLRKPGQQKGWKRSNHCQCLNHLRV